MTFPHYQWKIRSDSDPRWNCNGGATSEKVAEENIEYVLKILKGNYSEQPSDLQKSFYKT